MSAAVDWRRDPVRWLGFWGRRIREAEEAAAEQEAAAEALRAEIRRLDWRARRDADLLSYNDVQRRYALPELLAAAEREVHAAHAVLSDRWLKAKRWWREEAPQPSQEASAG